MNWRFRSELFEFAVSQLLRLKHALFAKGSLARVLRAAERRNVLEDLSLHEHMLADWCEWAPIGRRSSVT